MIEMLKDREKVAAIMRRLYANGLTTASGGNVSMRVGDRVLVTPSQQDKAGITGEQIGILTLDGMSLSTRIKKSMETGMHLEIYRKRPGIKAIVHAHPVMATSLMVSGRRIRTDLSGEARAILGEPVMTPYALMGTHELAEIVSEAAVSSGVVLMQNHGVLTLGVDLFQAYDRMEVLEAAAKMTLVTDMLGGAKGLNMEQLLQIDDLFK